MKLIVSRIGGTRVVRNNTGVCAVAKAKAIASAADRENQQRWTVRNSSHDRLQLFLVIRRRNIDQEWRVDGARRRVVRPQRIFGRVDALCVDGLGKSRREQSNLRVDSGAFLYCKVVFFCLKKKTNASMVSRVS